MDAKQALAQFREWCNDAPDQSDVIVKNTQALCDYLAEALARIAALERLLAAAKHCLESEGYEAEKMIPATAVLLDDMRKEAGG